MTGRTFLDAAGREGVTAAPSREVSLIGKVRIVTMGTGVRDRSLLRAAGGLCDVGAASLSDADGRLAEHNDADDGSDQRLRHPVGCIRTPTLSSVDALIGHLSTIVYHMANIVSGTVRNLGLDQKTETMVGVSQPTCT